MPFRLARSFFFPCAPAFIDVDFSHSLIVNGALSRDSLNAVRFSAAQLFSVGKAIKVIDCLKDAEDFRFTSH